MTPHATVPAHPTTEQSKSLQFVAGAMTDAVCAASFPKQFSSVQQWHRLEDGGLEAELTEALTVLEEAIASQLPPTAVFTVEGRVKSARSHFQKAFVRQKQADDLLAARVVLELHEAEELRAGCCSARCQEVAELASGINGWSERLPPKDYISEPKENGYQVAPR